MKQPFTPSKNAIYLHTPANTMRALALVKLAKHAGLKGHFASMRYCLSPFTPIMSIHTKRCAFGKLYTMRTVTIQFRSKTIASFSAMIRNAEVI